MATEKVKPIVRRTAQIDLVAMLKAQTITTTTEAVDYMLARFLSTAADSADRARLIEFLNSELGTDNVSDAETYLEEPLRLLLHLIMSLPEYQLG